MAPAKVESEYHCSLDKATLEKAKVELGEKPETRKLEVKQLKLRLEKVAGLRARTDFSFLLAFLRVRKFDQEKAFELVRHHYQEKQEKREHYDDIKPSTVRHVIEDNVIEVLRDRDDIGCRVVVVRPGRWDPDRYPINDLIKLFFLVLSKLSEEEETQVNGIHVIDLLDTVTWKQAMHVTPGMAKLLAGTMQDMLPLRLKRYDFVKEPGFFQTFFPILKSFMKDKLVQRITLNGDNLENLHKTVIPANLPTDLGGKLEPFSYNKEFMQMLLAAEKDFEHDNKFGFLSMTLESERSVKLSQDADMKGLGGSFKKLNV